MINGVRVRYSTVELSPTRWKFGRMDVSKARRGEGLEIDHNEIARRNTQALVTDRCAVRWIVPWSVFAPARRLPKPEMWNALA
jgi:hypothetical protein